jgi:polar amino acid transport system substrate-binding protein/glutamate/aspartate transport system substrate-binding protein
MRAWTRLWSIAILSAATALAPDAGAGTLDDIRAAGALRVAYREDAPPFSYKKDNAPAGYMVDLCRSVAAGLAKQIGIAELKVVFVPVTSVDRFDAITGNKADLLCEATTQTLKRRETMSFSIPTFADGASFIIRPSGPKELKELEGKKAGVLANTTTEQELRAALEKTQTKAEVVPAKTHEEGLAAVERGAVDAYFADRSILTFLFLNAKSQSKLMLADTYLSIEPYALALRRGDEDFRLAVDRELSRIYRSGEIAKIFTESFGGSVRPSPTLMGLYSTSALPQ